MSLLHSVFVLDSHSLFLWEKWPTLFFYLNGKVWQKVSKVFICETRKKEDFLHERYLGIAKNCISQLFLRLYFYENTSTLSYFPQYIQKYICVASFLDNLNFSEVTECIQMYLNVNRYIWMYSDVFKCIQMYLNVVICIWMYSDAFNCIYNYPLLFGCVCVHKMYPDVFNTFR